MSDMQMPGGMPGGMPTKPAPTGAPGRLSPMHGADRAYMQSRGMDKSMTIQDMVEKVYGLPITAPVSALQAKVGEMMKGGSAMGKAQQIGGQRPPTAPMGAKPQMSPQARPQAPSAPTQGQASGGLGGMLSKIQ